MQEDEKALGGARRLFGKNRDVNETQITTLGGRLAAGGALLTGLFTLLGISGSQLDRLLRNNPAGSIVLLALVAVGVMSGIILTTIVGQMSRRLVLVVYFVITLITLVASWAYLDWRDEPWEWAPAVVTLGTALLGGVLLMMAVRNGRLFVLIVGVLSMLAGLSGVGVLSVTSKSGKDRPRIEASLVRSESGWTIEAKVEAQGLTSREHIRILIEGLNEFEPLDGRRPGRLDSQEYVVSDVAGLPIGNDFNQTIQLSRLGPDADGRISATVKAPVSVGLYERVRVSALLETEHAASLLEKSAQLSRRAYELGIAALDAPLDTELQERAINAATRRDKFLARHQDDVDREAHCDLFANERACAVITMPQPGTQPRVQLTQAEGGVSLHVTASDLNVDDVVELVVADATEALYRATVYPSTNGVIDETVAVPVSDGPTRVCAAARIVEFPSRGVSIAIDRGTRDDGSQYDRATAVPGEPLVPLAIDCPRSASDWRIGSAELALPG